MIFEPESATIEYYNANAEEYIRRTQYFEVSDIVNPFVALLLSRVRILDLGCGAGRDSLTFQSVGFDVLAVDGAQKLIDHVKNLGVSAQKMFFEEIEFENEFEAVWSCANLMHVKKELLPDVLKRISRALKPKGICFASFKKGEGEGVEQGRYFHYLDEGRVKDYFQVDFEIISISSKESLLNYNPTTWISVTVQKK